MPETLANCLQDGSLAKLKEVSDQVYEMANVRPDRKMAFVGGSAFLVLANWTMNALP